MAKLILLGVLILMIVFVVAVVKFLPLPYALGVLLLAAIVLIVGIPWLIKRLMGSVFKRLITGVFGAKSKALRNATAEVHSITVTQRPSHVERDEDEDDDEEDSTPPADLVYYQIDVTITPAPNDSPFAMWEPGDLVLLSQSEPKVTFEDFASIGDDDDDNQEPAKEINSYEVIHVAWPEGGPVRPSSEALQAADDQAFAEHEYDEDDDLDKVRGPQRVLLTVGVPRSAPRELKFRYYFDDFGQIRLPATEAFVEASPSGGPGHIAPPQEK